MDERTLLVEDDRSLREIVVMILEGAGMRVTPEGDGRQALIRFRQEPFDLVVLDVMLPSLDGLAVCREIRRSSRVPILMLTAKAETADVVSGLEVGADDYLTKPFDSRELVARVHALMRRAVMDPEEPKRVVDGLEIDPSSFTVRKNGEKLHLSATEFRLLLELARHPGKVLSREVLLQRVWNYDYMGDSRLVDMAVKRLRDKVEDVSSTPQRITTVRGVGYRLEPG